MKHHTYYYIRILFAFLSLFAFSSIATYLYPVSIQNDLVSLDTQMLFGYFILLFGVISKTMIVRTHYQQKTHSVSAEKESDLKKGLYQVMEFPHYESLLFVFIGFGLVQNSVWFIVSAFLLFLTLSLSIFKKERESLVHVHGEIYRKAFNLKITREHK